jgi:hypothetical protein
MVFLIAKKKTKIFRNILYLLIDSRNYSLNKPSSSCAVVHCAAFEAFNLIRWVRI